MAALDQPSVIEQINPKIRVAKGYYCETTKQLLDAYKLLGVKDVVLKPVYGAAGEGIMFIHDDMELALYDFPMVGSGGYSRLTLFAINDTAYRFCINWPMISQWAACHWPTTRYHGFISFDGC